MDVFTSTTCVLGQASWGVKQAVHKERYDTMVSFKARNREQVLTSISLTHFYQAQSSIAGAVANSNVDDNHLPFFPFAFVRRHSSESEEWNETRTTYQFCPLGMPRNS